MLAEDRGKGRKVLLQNAIVVLFKLSYQYRWTRLHYIEDR